MKRVIAASIFSFVILFAFVAYGEMDKKLLYLCGHSQDYSTR